MKPNMKTVKETWSIVQIRKYIEKNYKKLSQDTLSKLYDIIAEQKVANEKFLTNFLNSEIFNLAYKAECRKSRRLQDVPLGEFINDSELIAEYGNNILDNMITIRDYFCRQDNSSKIAKIRWDNVKRDRAKALTQH